MAATLAVGGAPAAFAAESDSSAEDWPELVSTEPLLDGDESTPEEELPEGELPDESIEGEEPPEESTAEESEAAPEQSSAHLSVSQTEGKPVTKVSDNPVRTDLKPYTVKTEKVVEKQTKKSTKSAAKSTKTSKSSSGSDEDSEVGTITNYGLSTTSAKPKLTLEKQQSVNGGTKTTESVKANPGDTITYYLTLTNDESAVAAAKDVTIADNIPEGMTYVEGSAVGDATVSEGTVRWHIVTVNAGQSVLVSYQASIPEDAEAATYSGTANASCAIESEEASPKTADKNRPGLWLGGALVSLSAAVGAVLSLLWRRA